MNNKIKKLIKNDFQFFLQGFAFCPSPPDMFINLLQRLKASFELFTNLLLFLLLFFNFSAYCARSLYSCFPLSIMIIITKRSKLFFKLWYFLSNYTSPETLKKAKWIYRVSQKFVPLLYNFSTIGLGKQITETKFVFQSNSPFSYLLCQFFDSNIRFVHFRAKGARARVYFPATYFSYFIARIARTPSLFFVNITKNKSP